MDRGPGKLRGTTKPNGDYVWNSSGIIEGLVVYLSWAVGWMQLDFLPCEDVSLVIDTG